MRKAKIQFLSFFLSSVFAYINLSYGQDSAIKGIQRPLLATRWTQLVNEKNALPDYPRPQMERTRWTNLNGYWDYAITGLTVDRPEKFDGKILVPYPIESALSGVQKSITPTDVLWYKRNINGYEEKQERVLLHFGAVDWRTTVYLNGVMVGSHEGGYQPFNFDVTKFLRKGSNELLIKVFDPTDKGANPHGKQTLTPQGIMYTAISGIWQTVWLEYVPLSYIEKFTLTPDLDDQSIHVTVNAKYANTNEFQIELRASNGSSTLGKLGTPITLAVPNPHHWSPQDPYLYNLSIRLLQNNRVVDSVQSYFGMRKIEVRKDAEGIERLFLNNVYTFHLGVLDQGYWPDGLYTAPTDSALMFDILAIKNMGFNTIRKHIKIEPARWYYYADKIGMLVWQDMVNPSGDSDSARKQFEREIKENIAHLYNTPSIVIWVLFNEGWGAYDQGRMTQLMRHLDSSRIINGHTGENYFRSSPEDINKKWANSHLTDVHEYPGPGIPAYLPGKARVIGEWGGVGVSIPGHQWDMTNGWGYIDVHPSEFAKKYELMNKHLKIFEEEGLSGAIYTEPFDVELERNGLITYDRKIIKIPYEQLQSIHSRIVKHTCIDKSLTDYVRIQIADTTNPYKIGLKKFALGNRDRSFLRELVQISLGKNDTTTAYMVVDEYVRSLNNGFTIEDVQFIKDFLRGSTSLPFKFIVKNWNEIEKNGDDVVLGILPKIKEIVTREFSERTLFDYVTSDVILDFKSIEDAGIKHFGSVSKRVIWSDIARYNYVKSFYDTTKGVFITKSTNVFTKKYIPDFIQYKNKILKKFPNDIDSRTLNADAWFVFINSMDKNELESALDWAKNAINKEGDNFYYLDTYANLLYKLGKKDQAINIQKQAVQLSKRDVDFVETLSKMERGVPTWN